MLCPSAVAFCPSTEAAVLTEGTAAQPQLLGQEGEEEEERLAPALVVVAVAVRLAIISLAGPEAEAVEEAPRHREMGPRGEVVALVVPDNTLAPAGGEATIPRRD